MKADILMAIAVLPTILLFSLPSGAASLYTNDGDISDRLELERWYINRARFAPEMEADRLGLTNTASGGHPNYDVCEDSAEANDFGTTTNEWNRWKQTRGPLAPNARLSKASATHCRDMAETGFFQHESPSAHYYPLGSSPWTRAALEGYTNAIVGYYENIAWGSMGGSGSYPPEGRNPTNVHRALFIDTSSSVRGHRQAILNPSAREMGLGTYRTNIYSTPWYYTYDYDTQDFGCASSNYFFTETVFFDANTNSSYDKGEGVSGIEIHLWDGTNEAAWYDVSTASGNFAIPIGDLPGNHKITIQLINTNTATRRISIPWGFNTMGDIDLTNRESMVVGTYFQPRGLTNVGFRNLIPMINASISWLDTNAVITFNTFIRTGYRIETCVDGTFTNWIPQPDFIAKSEQTAFFDPASVSRTACFYRVVLIRE
jgi:uncharacterized protein YkwD